MSEVLDTGAVPSSPLLTTKTHGQHQEPAQHCSEPRQRSASAGAGPSSQRVVKVYATTADAIANFKPTPREVISGIAPHVFDERKRRRNQQRAPKPYWYSPSGEKRSSPLRGATIISWDEHSIYLEQSAPQHGGSAERVTATSSADVRDVENPEHSSQQATVIKKRPAILDKSGWKYFRVDVHLLKSVVDKLKFSTSQNSSSKPRN
ncbi:hypothetical protein BDZ97DRAFT_1781021 [Flammula alnicola]|nr:hypothetical protein BDZ97DRAFT_1781021 [Flammula alnicola]